MNASGRIPKWATVSNAIRSDIFSGNIKVGEQLPPDTALAEMYGIDKRTVAKGMAVLVKEGLISRAPRRGSMVISDHRPVVAGGTSNAVCIIGSNDGHFYEELAYSLDEKIIEAGLYPVWFNSKLYTQMTFQPDHYKTRKFLRAVLPDRPFGFIIDADRFFPFDFIRENIQSMGNIVFMFHYLHNERLPGKYCCHNYFEVGKMLACYLAGRGHRNIAFFSAPQPLIGGGWQATPHEMIVDGIDEYCRSEGLYFDCSVASRFFHGELPMNIIADLKNSGRLPDAVIAHSDSFCVREIFPACAALGIKIPEDMSVLGCMNTPWCQAVSPELSSVDFCASDIAEASVSRLLNPYLSDVELKIKIVERRSVIDKVKR